MRFIFLVLLASSFSVPPLSAQDAPARLRLADVVAEALQAHPDIAAARQRYDAARQRPVQEGSLPDPMLSGGWTSSGNPLPGAGLGVEPMANMPETVLVTSPQVPTIAATIAVPITSAPIRIDSRLSSRL